MTELFAGKTSYWLVLAKSGGGGAGAAGGTCCPGSDGGAASRGCVSSAGRSLWRLALFGGAGVAGARAVWRWSAAQGLRALGRFVDAGWQDLRAVHDSRGPCSEKCPFLARSSRGVPERRFAGHFGCMARISCHSQLVLDTWRANLATNWRFSRPRPLLGCMERKTCHGLPPENAPGRNIATARPPGTHRASILPLPVRPRAHQGAVPPPSDAGKRISRAFCHRRAPGKRTVAEYCHYQSPESAFAKILPWTNAWIPPHQITAATLPQKKRHRRQLEEERPRQKHERQSAGAAGASSRYGAVQRHRRTLGNAARRNIAMADNAPRDKRRRAFCSPSFAFLFTAGVAMGTSR